MKTTLKTISKILPLLLLSGTIACSDKKMDMLLLPGQGVAPKVLASYPTDGAFGVNTNQEFWILFDRPMDIQKTQSSFRVSSSRGQIFGDFRWEGTKLFFKPSSKLNTPELFTMNLDKTAEATGGVNISKDLIVRFYTVYDIMKPRFVSSTPANNSTGVSPNTTITLHFSEPIAYSSIASGLSIAPSFVHTISQSTTLTDITITPSAPLPNGSYTIKMNQNLTDMNGNGLFQDALVSFVVGADFFAPSIISVNSGPLPLTEGLYTAGAEKNGLIVIQFSEPMDQVATEKAITLSPAAYWTRTWNAAGDQITLTFSPQLSSDTYYLLTVDTQARDLATNPIAKNYSFGFITNAPASVAPKVIDLYQSTTAAPSFSPGCDGIVSAGLSASLFNTAASPGYPPLDLSWMIDADPIPGSALCTAELLVRFNNSMVRNSFLGSNTTFTAVLDPTNSTFTIQDIQVTGTDVRIRIETAAAPTGGTSTPIYKLTIKGGTNGIYDINNNFMAQDYTVLFTF